MTKSSGRRAIACRRALGRPVRNKRLQTKSLSSFFPQTAFPLGLPIRLRSLGQVSCFCVLEARSVNTYSRNALAPVAKVSELVE